MKAALGKKWFLLTELSSCSHDFKKLPDRETRVYEEFAGGYRLLVVGTVGSRSYDWQLEQAYDGLPQPSPDGNADEQIVVAKVSETMEIGTVLERGTVKATCFSEVISDAATHRETLRIVRAQTAGSASPAYEILLYRGAKL